MKRQILGKHAGKANVPDNKTNASHLERKRQREIDQNSICLPPPYVTSGSASSRTNYSVRNETIWIRQFWQLSLVYHWQVSVFPTIELFSFFAFTGEKRRQKWVLPKLASETQPVLTAQSNTNIHANVHIVTKQEQTIHREKKGWTQPPSGGGRFQSWRLQTRI